MRDGAVSHRRAETFRAIGVGERLAAQLPSPVRRLDVLASLGPIGEAGFEPSWYRYTGGETPELLRPELDPSLPLAAELAELGPYEVLAYRPCRSLVIRRDSPRGQVVERGYREGGSTLAGLRYRIASEALSGSPLRAPRVLVSRRESEALALTWLEGARPELDGRWLDVFRVLGRGLRSLQEFTVAACLPVFRHRDELEMLDRSLARLELLQIASPEGWPRCRAVLDLRLAELMPARPVLSQRDFREAHVRVVGDRVAFADFDRLCLADPALDPASLLAHLELRALQQPGSRATEALAILSSGFLEGLAARDADFGARLRAYRAAALLDLALSCSLRPAFREVVPALVHRAGRWLGL